jgi:hypothetical protein
MNVTPAGIINIKNVQDSLYFAIYSPNLPLLGQYLRSACLIVSQSGTTVHFVKVSWFIGKDSCLCSLPLSPNQIVSLCEDMNQIWILETYGKQSIQCAA